jgi:uncharacterized damage-inducible protein DinB
MSALPNTIPTSQAEKEQLLLLLRESREKFLNSFTGVSDEQSHRKPAEDRWSVLDTVEHLTTAETIQCKLVTTQRAPRAADAPNREKVFLQVIADRSHKAQSPESARPRGRFANLAEAAAQFKASRESAIRFVETTTEDLRATQVRHPHPAAGDVSTFEMLIIMAKHAERHALQIEEIRETLGLRTATI